LLEALKEQNYEHYIIGKRFEELLSKLDKDPHSAIRDLLLFLKNVMVPHFSREEKTVFPAILNIRPQEERLILQLKEEHKTILSLLPRIRQDSLDSAKESIKELSIMGAKHVEKEEPLYQMVLEEVLKRLGKSSLKQ